MDKIKLAENYSVPATDYATQGNAVLGIRDSGKTYTGTKAAEGLLDAGIPIIVFDPIGIWKNLKIGTGKHKGYPIVVAGGEGSDIKLTPQNAVEIVRAAMKENVSLVIDLYSPELINKSTWIRIVQEAVDELMYQNKNYGVRHVFIEEAAEFIPQRLQPQHSKVYASLERLARMGRNAHLGMTIINQRAEEVNKAILEIMALCLLHKQVGKNSLLSIKKWLELRSIDKAAESIINQLPQLKQGECFVISDDAPMKIKVLPKNTFHPDPKKPTDPVINNYAINVTSFVEKLKIQLYKKETPTKTTVSLPVTKNANQNSKSEDLSRQLQIRNGELVAQLKAKDQELQMWKKLAIQRAVHLNKIDRIIDESLKLTEPDHTFMTVLKEPNLLNNGSKLTSAVPKLSNLVSPKPVIVSSGDGSLGKCARELLKWLAAYPERSFTKAQVAIASGDGYAVGGGNFNNAISQLNTAGYIINNGSKISVNKMAMDEIIRHVGEISPQPFDAGSYSNKLTKCEKEIYSVLLDQPHGEFTRDELALATDSQYASGSGNFNNALSRLNTLELIVKDRGIIRLNPELVEMM